MQNTPEPAVIEPLAVCPARDLLAMLTADGDAIPFEAIRHAVTDSRDVFRLEFSSNRKNAPTIVDNHWSRGAQAMRGLDLHWHTGRQAGGSGGRQPS